MTYRWRCMLPALLLAFCPMTIFAEVPREPETSATDARQSTQARQYLQWRQQAVRQLAERSDVNSQYAAAVLLEQQWVPSDSDESRQSEYRNDLQWALALLDQAAAQAADAPEIALLASKICGRLEDCDADYYGMLFQESADDDASAWVHALQQAQDQGDSVRVTELLNRMARADQFSNYQMASASRLADALAHVSLPWQWQRQSKLDALLDKHPQLFERAWDVMRGVYALVWSSMTSQQASKPMVRACKPGQDAMAERRAACRRLGRLLQGNGSLLDYRMGLVLLRFAAENEAQKNAALADEHRINWQTQQFRELDSAQPVPEEDADVAALRRFIDSSSKRINARYQYGNELAAMQARLKAADIPLEPPADWVDKQQRSRIKMMREQRQAREAATAG